MANGLVRVRLDGGMADNPTDQEETPSAQVADLLGQTLHSKFIEWRDARKDKEDEWIEDLKAYNGMFDSIEESVFEYDFFYNITRTKTRTAYAKAVDLLFQSKDKPWGVDPTPIPEVSPIERKRLTEIVFAETGEIPTKEETETMVRELAEKRAEKMEALIEDQLAECHFETEAKISILEQHVLGTGCVKGPYTASKHNKQWHKTEAGWAVYDSEERYPKARAVSIFDTYPDPHAVMTDECEGVYERHVLTKQHVIDLKEQPGFDDEAIDDVLMQYEKGNHELLEHERSLRDIAGYNTITDSTNRYEVLEYWGEVSGRDLESAGVKEVDIYGVYQANVWVCGHRTIYAKLNKSQKQRLPYQFFPYERVPHQFWGIGVPRQMRDSQMAMNATVQSLIDNVALSSGFQAEFNMSLMADGEDPRKVKRNKVWLREGGDEAYPLIRFYKIPDNSKSLTSVLQEFRKFADEETSMPSYTHGEVSPGLNKTASGMSMLMSQANITTKSVIKNTDDFLFEPLMQAMYDWNMEWSDDESIKGDMQVQARGSSVLVAKEIQAQNLMRFMEMTANPVDGPLTERLQLLRNAANAMELNAGEVVKDDEEADAILRQIGGGGNLPPQPGPGMGNPDELPGPEAAGIA